MNVKGLILCSLLLAPAPCEVTVRDYAEALKAVSTEVLSRYVIAFYPDRGKRPDGNFHQLSVQVSGGMTVSLSQRGYAGKGAR